MRTQWRNLSYKGIYLSFSTDLSLTLFDLPFIYHWPTSDLPMTCRWFTTDLPFDLSCIYRWLTIDLLLVYFDLPLIYLWLTFDLPFIYHWPTSALSLIYLCCVFVHSSGLLVTLVVLKSFISALCKRIR